MNLEKQKPISVCFFINNVFDAEGTALDDSRIKW